MYVCVVRIQPYSEAYDVRSTYVPRSAALELGDRHRYILNVCTHCMYVIPFAYKPTYIDTSQPARLPAYVLYIDRYDVVLYTSM